MSALGVHDTLWIGLIIPILALLNEDEQDEEPRDIDPQVSWLRSVGDREALAQLLERDRQLTQGLDAAEALAELGDVRGFDHLIATLNGSSAYLRQMAARILRQFNHPRALSALENYAETPDTAPTASVDAPGPRFEGERLFEDLNGRDTDELMHIWRDHDRSRWPAEAFYVLEDILTKRLGDLPPRTAASAQFSAASIDANVQPEIRRLWILGDLDQLDRILQNETDESLRLEAAEALTALGDEDALDILIAALDDSDVEIREMAAEILDWLDVPRGNTALKDRGIEFEPTPEKEARPSAARVSREIDDDIDPEIRQLWLRGDLDELQRILTDASESLLQLEAAEALAALGDAEALDLLIASLDDRDSQVGDIAAEILDWLDLPRGNRALAEHGFQFETAGEPISEVPPPAAAPATLAPPASRTSTLLGTQAAPGIPAQPALQAQNPALVGSWAHLITGAIGGLLGWTTFAFGLYFLGRLPPGGPESWGLALLIHYLPWSLAVGALAGALGANIANSLGRRMGNEPGEGDMLPVLGALIEGAGSALVVCVAVYYVIGLK